MDSHRLGFDHSTRPQRLDRTVESCVVGPAPVDLIDECDVLAIGKEERELLVSGAKMSYTQFTAPSMT